MPYDNFKSHKKNTVSPFVYKIQFSKNHSGGQFDRFRVKQGDILSTMFFHLFTNDLSMLLEKSNTQSEES